MVWWKKVRLADGREVLSDSQAFRHESEARCIARLPTLAERRNALAEIEAKRGKEAADALRKTIEQHWERFRERST